MKNIYKYLLSVLFVSVFSANAATGVTTPNPKQYSDAVRNDLLSTSSSKGAALLNTKSLSAGSKVRTQQDKNDDFLSVLDFTGVDKTGVSDSTTGLQAAIDAAAVSGKKLYIPAGNYKTTAPLNITLSVRIVGDGAEPYKYAIGTIGGGTWLHFAHLGKGFNVVGTNVISGIKFSQFGTYRDQPAPTVSWLPAAADFDIYISNADVLIDDLTLLNPTKGIRLDNGNAGRLEINTLRGQAMQVMVDIDTSYDLCKLNNIHQWAFWKDDANIHAYTQQNLDVIYSKRNDNPFVTNLFTIFARSAIRFGQNANGKTAKIHLVNGDFDRGVFGIYIDSTVTGGVTGQFLNVSHQGETGLAGSKAIYILGNNSTLEFSNFRSDLANQNTVRVEGTSNLLTFSNLTALNYNQSAGGFPAIEALVNNTIKIDGFPNIAGGGAGVKYGSTGKIFVDDWQVYTPTITTATGSITTLGSVSGIIKRLNSSIEFVYDIPVTTNGTGAGSVNATLPETIFNNFSEAVGRESAISGKSLTGHMSPGVSIVNIQNYDNTYPAVNGARLIITGRYRTQ